MKKNKDIFDLTKIILSLMVVAIHSKLFPMILYPWLRLAVPLFFLISSYLLYTKIKKSNSSDRKIIIKNYIIRLLKLYLFWFVALLPLTLYARKEWFTDGILAGIVMFILKFFISSTFKASWYIMATVLGTLIVEKLSCKCNYIVLILIFLIIYLICCYTSSYSFLISWIKVPKIISYINFEPHCSFCVSLIYILFGKIIAENKIRLNRNIAVIFVLAALLYIEWYVIYKLSGSYNNDCYIFIMPISILIFNYIKDVEIKINNSRTLRQISNFIYPLHASICSVLWIFIESISSNDILNGIICFIITILICVISFNIVKIFEKKIKILKYAY